MIGLVEDLKIANDNLYSANKMLEKEIERLNKKIEQYENPEDMTLMFMWCDEKAKDEIKRLNNIINKGIEAINVYQNEKTLSVGYQDLKKIRGILQGNEFDLQMFEEYLQELKGSDSNE